MSDVLVDPDFVSRTRIIVTRSTPMVGDDGIRTATQQVFANVIAVVTQNDDINLLREASSQRLSGSITIHTKFRLTDSNEAQGLDADIVTYLGRLYTVVSIGDWSEWGAGFIMAVATLTEINP